MRNDLSADFVRDLFDYSAEAGTLSWKPGLNRPGHFLGFAGTKNGKGYIQIQLNKKLYLAHRLVWLYVYGKWPRDFLDHVNGDRADNRIENLRQASRLENNRNRCISSHNRSGFKGVHVRKNGRIQASIKSPERQIFLGYFPTLTEATTAYEAAAKEMFGEFVRRN